ncbi:MAG: response regulator [Desulfobulbaceae bacterium A2]|nr:MAG: response regulator [Desulfobulbaceae bacterium A2]
MQQRTISSTDANQDIGNGLKILVADDDPVVRRLLEERLRKSGFTVAVAADGMEAARLLAASRFDVVLTDMVMPGDIDGLDLLRISKAECLETEVILITAHSSVETAVRAMKDGASDYLEKPINFEELLLRLEKIREIKSLVRNASDLRSAMDTTEQEAAQTIQRLEIELSRQQELLHGLAQILRNDALDEGQRLEQAVELLERGEGGR